MINTLHTMLGNGATQQYDDLLGVSENSRIRAVSALIEKYQRMSVAMPLREVRPETTSFWSSPSVATMLSSFRRRGRPVEKTRTTSRDSYYGNGRLNDYDLDSSCDSDAGEKISLFQQFGSPRLDRKHGTVLEGSKDRGVKTYNHMTEVEPESENWDQKIFKEHGGPNSATERRPGVKRDLDSEVSASMKIELADTFDERKRRREQIIREAELSFATNQRRRRRIAERAAELAAELLNEAQIKFKAANEASGASKVIEKKDSEEERDDAQPEEAIDDPFMHCSQPRKQIRRTKTNGENGIDLTFPSRETKDGTSLHSGSWGGVKKKQESKLDDASLHEKGIHFMGESKEADLFWGDLSGWKTKKKARKVDKPQEAWNFSDLEIEEVRGKLPSSSAKKTSARPSQDKLTQVQLSPVPDIRKLKTGKKTRLRNLEAKLAERDSEPMRKKSADDSSNIEQKKKVDKARPSRPIIDEQTDVQGWEGWDPFSSEKKKEKV